METKNNQFRFKTNIHCGGCMGAVKPFLDAQQGVKTWDVDINHPDKILVVEAEGLTEDQIAATVRKAGFSIESL